MPSLLRLAGEPAPGRAAVEVLSRTIDEALATAEAAGYRVDALLDDVGPATDSPASHDPASPVSSIHDQPDSPVGPAKDSPAEAFAVHEETDASHVETPAQPEPEPQDN